MKKKIIRKIVILEVVYPSFIVASAIAIECYAPVIAQSNSLLDNSGELSSAFAILNKSV
jgi:hypothetical protein